MRFERGGPKIINPETQCGGIQIASQLHLLFSAERGCQNVDVRLSEEKFCPVHNDLNIAGEANVWGRTIPVRWGVKVIHTMLTKTMNTTVSANENELYICHCPSCNKSIITTPDAVDQGIRCPQCSVGFVPDKLETFVAPPEDAPPRRSPVLKARAESQSAPISSEYSEVNTTAHQWSVIAVIFMYVGLVLSIAAGVIAAAGELVWALIYCALGSLSLGFWLLLLAQLFHIRAALIRHRD